MLRQKYSDAEAQAIIEAENLQDEIRRREEVEKLHVELQQLLLAEKEAREAEATARALQEDLLLNEKKRLQEMEKMKAEKEALLQEELKKRESLEEKQKLQDKLLEEVYCIVVATNTLSKYNHFSFAQYFYRKGKD